MESIERIASFSVNHDKLTEGIYVSRIDGDITSYDLRTRSPNMGDYMDNVSMHSVEHMFATYIRNSEIGSRVIYFGPMGCRTGFYLLVRDADNMQTLSAIKQTLTKIINHTGDVFGKSSIECGNYRELDIDKAKIESLRYLDILNSASWNFEYEV